MSGVEDERYWDEVEQAWAQRPDPTTPRRPRSAGGAMLAAAMLGLGEVLDPKKPQEVVIEVESDQPDEPVDGIHLHFDPDSPKNTVAVVPPP